MDKCLLSIIIISSAIAVSAEETISDSTASVENIQQRDTTTETFITSQDSVLNRLEDTLIQVKRDIDAKKSLIESADEDLSDQIDDEIDVLEDKIDELEDRIEELQKAKSGSRTQDTIDAEYIFNRINEKRIIFSEKVSKSRAQGFGGGVIIQPMILGVKMKPIKKFALQNSSLRQYSFSDLQSKYNPVLVMGAFGYGGVGNGLRIGFGGWGGDAYYEGDRVDGNMDSVMILNLQTSFGGMFLEKALIHKNLNFVFGGVIGGGKYSLKRSVQSDNAFNSFDAWDNTDDDSNEAKATFAGLEMHSGLTVTVLPWMHFGLDLNTLFSFSVSGFRGLGGTGFTTVNPGVRLRIVLGNLG
jgi:hypothetical protein